MYPLFCVGQGHWNHQGLSAAWKEADLNKRYEFSSISRAYQIILIDHREPKASSSELDMYTGIKMYIRSILIQLYFNTFNS